MATVPLPHYVAIVYRASAAAWPCNIINYFRN